MKCDVCGLRTASGVISMISGGRSVTRRICTQCMLQLRRPSAYTIQMTLLGTLPQQETEQHCPVCGRSEQTVRRTGRLGCPKCYQAFEPLLAPLVEQLGSAQRKETPSDGAGAPQPAESAIDRLREEMFRAVNAEEYERAAELRDEIRALQAARREAEE